MEVIEGETLTKVCTKCGVEKELEGFYKKKGGKFGRQAACKACAAEYDRKWREENPEYARKYYEDNREYYRKWREENREALLEYDRKWREENREALLEYYRKYYEENREALREYGRKYREENREYFRKYREDNPHVGREKERRRRARKLENGVVPYQEVDIFERDNWTCQLCNKPIDPSLEYRNEDGSVNTEYKSIDHVIPVSKGGADAPDNVQAAHLGCNISKGNRIEDEDALSRA